MKKTFKRFMLLSMALFVLVALGCGKKDKEESVKTQVVKVICPYGAGGTADAIARKYAKIASELYSEYNFVVENKTGGDGFVAAAYYQGVNPEAKELFILGYGNAYRHNLGKKFGTEQVPFDLENFKPLATVDDRTWILYAKPGTTLEDVIKKAKEGSLKMSGGNPLSDPHLALGSLLAVEGGRVTVVAYDGGAAQKQGLTSGEVDVFVGTTQAGMGEVEAGTIIPILAFSENSYEGLMGPKGLISVPGLVNNRAKGLSSDKDYSGSILPAGGFVAGRTGSDKVWSDKVVEISKAVWASPEYSNWIQEIGLNRLEIYGDNAQTYLDKAIAKSEKAFKMLSSK